MSGESSEKGYLLGAVVGITVVGVLHGLGVFTIEGTSDSALYYGVYGGCGGIIVYELFRRLFGNN